VAEVGELEAASSRVRSWARLMRVRTMRLVRWRETWG
jgi:hypothetical protein